MAPIAEIRSWRSQLSRIGVCPPGAKVRRALRGEHGARLVEKGRVGPASPGLADDRWQFLTPSVGDGDLVAFPGLPLGLLAGPPRPTLEDLADMLGVEMDGETPLDQVGDAVGGPELGLPTVGLGPLLQEPLQAPQPVGGQAGRGAGVGLGRQPIRRGVGDGLPTIQRGAAGAENTGNDGGRLPLLHQLDDSATSAFRFLNGSDGPHTLGFTTSSRARRARRSAGRGEGRGVDVLNGKTLRAWPGALMVSNVLENRALA